MSGWDLLCLAFYAFGANGAFARGHSEGGKGWDLALTTILWPVLLGVALGWWAVGGMAELGKAAGTKNDPGAG